MKRELAALSLLFVVSACAPAEPVPSTSATPSSSASASAAPQAGSTAPADKVAAGACNMVARVVEQQDVRFTSNSPIAMRARKAADPGVRDAGERLAVAAKESGDMFVRNDPNEDTGPVDARMAEAQRGLLSACTALFGPQPWPFAPSPTPTT
ncbi:hypothetical protein DQE82_23260 [Micromonospora sp. LHW51205]|uniref:hypothetical protein n=1 Tax=Micromonospora sp. LHW51205 TaxID=2248752 RepID=UPI000DE9DF0A|nr:hypothetical protein [Micromonospora sp. LHW51205]RBQ06573.1 hypothetical protein DQE82_23260 [Micromonospora sp. LHW51205]